MLDDQCLTWNNYPAQHCMQSHHIDGYPRLLFTSGISNLSNLKADDKVGILFCIIVAALQEEGSSIFLEQAGIENKQLMDIIYVFEMILCYRAWLKKIPFGIVKIQIL